jgi:hypothetical protein
MSNKRRNPFSPFCDQNAGQTPHALAARYARICLDPMVWPLTPQVPRPASAPSAFMRWFRKGIRRPL